MLLVFAVVAPALWARADDDVANEYRLTLSTHHPIKGDLTGFGEFEYHNNPEMDYQAYELLWPGLTYSIKHWFQLSGGLTTRYTDNEQSAQSSRGSLEYADNIFQLNIKVGLAEGLLRRLHNPRAGD